MTGPAERRPLASLAAEGDNLIRLMGGAFDPLEGMAPVPGEIPAVPIDDVPADVPTYWLVQAEAGDFRGASAAIEAGRRGHRRLRGRRRLRRAGHAGPDRRDHRRRRRCGRRRSTSPATRCRSPSASTRALLDLEGEQSYRVYVFETEPDPAAVRAAVAVGARDERRVRGRPRPRRAGHRPSSPGHRRRSRRGVDRAHAGARADERRRPLGQRHRRAGRVHGHRARPPHRRRADGRRRRHRRQLPPRLQQRRPELLPRLRGRRRGDRRARRRADGLRGRPLHPGQRRQQHRRPCRTSSTTAPTPARSSPTSTSATPSGISGDPSNHGTHVAGSVVGDTTCTARGTGPTAWRRAPASCTRTSARRPAACPARPTTTSCGRQAYRPSDPASVATDYDPRTSTADHYDDYVPRRTPAPTTTPTASSRPIVDLGNAAAADEFVWEHEDMVIVASAGNEGPGPAASRPRRSARTSSRRAPRPTAASRWRRSTRWRSSRATARAPTAASRSTS